MVLNLALALLNHASSTLAQKLNLGNEPELLRECLRGRRPLGTRMNWPELSIPEGSWALGTRMDRNVNRFAIQQVKLLRSSTII